MISSWVGLPLDASQRVLVFLPTRQGGLGYGAAELRRGAAYVGSWEQCLSAVASSCGVTTAADLFAQAPRTIGPLFEAQANLQQQGVGANADWESRMAHPRRRRQREWSQEVQDTMHGRLLAELPELDRADPRSAGGPGAGAFLLCPPKMPISSPTPTSARLCGAGCVCDNALLGIAGGGTRPMGAAASSHWMRRSCTRARARLEARSSDAMTGSVTGWPLGSHGCWTRRC